MGQYAEIEITAEFDTSETAKRVCVDLENKIRKFIEKRAKNDGFDFHIQEPIQTVEAIQIFLNSGRHENAEWQAQQIFEYLKETYKNELQIFNAEMMLPETIISYEIGQEEEIEES